MGIAHLVGLRGAAFQAGVLQTSMPTAVITTILAVEFDVAPGLRDERRLCVDAAQPAHGHADDRLSAAQLRRSLPPKPRGRGKAARVASAACARPLKAGHEPVGEERGCAAPATTAAIGTAVPLANAPMRLPAIAPSTN